jgi:hypothetical protein
MAALKTLRPGEDEKIYERALVIDLRLPGLKSDNQAGSDETDLISYGLTG